MKVGLIGHGVAALAIATKFLREEAEVILFSDGQNPLTYADFLLGLELPDYADQGSALIKAWDDFKSMGGQWVEDPVKRLQKRYLGPTEPIAGRTRLHDLFRIVLERTPRQSDFNPEQLGQSIVADLSRKHELFYDVDLVVHVPEAKCHNRPIRFLNQEYASDFLASGPAELVRAKDELTGDLVFIGDTETSALGLIYLESWLIHKRGTVSIVTDNKTAFAKVLNNPKSKVSSKLNQTLELLMTNFKQECETYSKEIQEYRALSDEQKKGRSLPDEPKRPLIFYEGFSLTAMDRLSDREKLYLTIESPRFREVYQKDELKTLETDKVFLFDDNFYGNDFNVFLIDKEPGYFLVQADPEDPYARKSFEKVWMHVLEFFSRA